MIHVVIPFSRFHLMEELTSLYQDKNIFMHCIVFPSQYKQLDNLPDWIKIIVVYPEVNIPLDIAYYKIQKHLDSIVVNDDDYYYWTSDDNSIEEDVFFKIREMKDEVIFISMKRGDNIIKRPDQSFAQGSNTLFAKPENVKRGGIALGQIFVKGRVAKKMKWDWTIHWADGKMAIWLKDNYHIKYEPNLYSLFDWFEPGRWNK